MLKRLVSRCCMLVTIAAVPRAGIRLPMFFSGLDVDTEEHPTAMQSGALLSLNSVAACGHSSVDDDLGSGDEAGFFAGEEQGGVAGVAAVSHEAQWYPLLSFLE